jgi:DedD protein
MPLSSLFKRKAAPGAESPTAPMAGDEPPLVAAARVRARRRLIGAVVLLGVGIIGFPLLFETAPRPIPVDIPIEIPRKDAVAPLPMPAPGASGMAARPPALAVPPDAGAELPASAAVAEVPASSAPATRTAASAPAARVAASAPPAKASASATAAKQATDGQRAKALLDGVAAASTAPTAPAAAVAASQADDKAARFVVQVGAYTDPNALREARAKVEKLGLKTYTQVIETEAGKRTRVRTGPFASREEADAAVRTLKAAGLPGNILAL